MVWEPFALAIVFGLVVSAGLYFIVMWPQVEPDEDADEDADDDDAASASPTGDTPAAVASPAPVVEAGADGERIERTEG